MTGGQGPSQILGTLTSNGRCSWSIPTASCSGRARASTSAGLLATTNDIANGDFMAGQLQFHHSGQAERLDRQSWARITAQTGGFAALVAPGVRNTGTITATLGTVALASGNVFTLDLYGDKLITLAVNDSIAVAGDRCRDRRSR